MKIERGPANINVYQKSNSLICQSTLTKATQFTQLSGDATHKHILNQEKILCISTSREVVKNKRRGNQVKLD